MQHLCLLAPDQPSPAKPLHIPGLLAGEHISALALLHWSATSRTPTCQCALLGTTHGHLLVLSQRGHLLFKQLVHDSPMRKVRLTCVIFMDVHAYQV